MGISTLSAQSGQVNLAVAMILFFSSLGLIAMGARTGRLTAGEHPLSPADWRKLPAEEAFGVEPPHKVASVKEMDVAAFRDKIASAEIFSAIDIALLIAGREQEAFGRTITSVTCGEGCPEFMVTVEDRGYLDDSLLGYRLRIWVAKLPDNQWKLERVLWSRIGRSGGEGVIYTKGRTL